jgi:hypothetical protein
MAKNSIEKEIYQLNNLLESDFLYKENLQVLGKFLFDNLPEVDGIRKGTQKSFENGEKKFILIVIMNRDIVIYEDGKIESRFGAEYVTDHVTLYWLLRTINETLETTDQLAKDIKTVLRLLKK